MKKPTTPTGNFGEDLSADYLKKKKYKVLKRNWRTKIGEIDILASDKDCIVIIEVKTKTNPDFGHPAEMVDYFKQKKLITLARFIQKVYPNNDIRIDVVAVDLSVEPPNIEHIENAVLANG